jgi:molecular chaperone DnaK (HSP70)
MKLGVDFGTTRTVVACADRGNYPVVSFVDESGDARDFYPSLVADRGGELLFGWDAAAAAADPASCVLRSFKRLLADPSAVPGRTAQVGRVILPLGELLTRFLEALREAVVKRSNAPRAARDAVLRAVVATPANAHGAQRFVTLDAFRRAGFEVAAMLNEPSAAGFEYTHRHRDTLSSKRENVVVYDLGGGTFDASLVRMRGRAHEVVATAGVNRLGGDDFDDELVKLVLARAGVHEAALGERALGRLRDQCREAKERLNPSSRKITIDLEAALEAATPARAPEVTIAVSEFYDACMPLVERSVEAMAPVITRLGEDGEPQESLDGVAGIYVVGGGSELPIVARALRERFGRRVHRSPYPSAAIAIGLAIACDDEAGFELADRFSRTFGVFREAHAGGEITFDPIFVPGTELPARGAGARRIRRAYRAAHNLGHFRFLECTAVGDDGRPRGDMLPFGDVVFPFDPALRAGQGELRAVEVERRDAGGPEIEEEYALDENGIVEVTIRDLGSDYARSYRLG